MQALEEAFFYLPERMRLPIRRVSARLKICEIRIRRDLPLSVTGENGNILIGECGAVGRIGDALKARAEELEEIVDRLCEQSVYRHADALWRGYLITPGGLRAGLCGQMLYDAQTRDWKPDLKGFTGINLRIPRLIDGAADALINYYESHALCSALIYSPPGAGKTTMLRDLARRLSCGAYRKKPFRVAVIDERRELFPERSGFSCGLLDLISGLPKALAIERAVRLLNPQVLICDELGLYEDTRALLTASSSGIVFLASAHAESRAALFQQSALKELLCAQAFQVLCGIRTDPVLGRTYCIEEVG